MAKRHLTQLEAIIKKGIKNNDDPSVIAHSIIYLIEGVTGCQCSMILGNFYCFSSKDKRIQFNEYEEILKNNK